MQVHRHLSLAFSLMLFVSCGPDAPGETADGASTTSTATTGSDASVPTTSDSLTTSADATTTADTTGDDSTTTEDVLPVPPPALPCEDGTLLVQTADHTPSGLEWCPGDSIHRYAAASCNGGGACQVDDDCGADRACLCLSDFDGLPDETTCIPARCHTDADCPGDQQCGLDPSICGWYVTPGLVCRSPADECAGNDECESWCAFDGDVQHWLCGDSWFCE